MMISSYCAMFVILLCAMVIRLNQFCNKVDVFGEAAP